MKLSVKNLKTANELALASFEKWNKVSKQGSGTYNHNRIDGCLIGTKCEVAIYQFLAENDVVSHAQFLDLNSVNDLLSGKHILESKGLRENQWDRFKRCVPPSQLSKYVNKGALVVWGTATVNPKDENVQLRGWNYAQEIQDKGRFIRTICDNIWLEKDEDMRNMNSLLKILKTV